mmetsp:Transcript_105932/g.304580  ORF Transcript_105932/g.304580 Transcript_105932/m.304580 type:complete len:246 (-) Transcript_105932:51-788(-)
MKSMTSASSFSETCCSNTALRRPIKSTSTFRLTPSGVQTGSECSGSSSAVCHRQRSSSCSTSSRRAPPSCVGSRVDTTCSKVSNGTFVSSACSRNIRRRRRRSRLSNFSSIDCVLTTSRSEPDLPDLEFARIGAPAKTGVAGQERALSTTSCGAPASSATCPALSTTSCGAPASSATSREPEPRRAASTAYTRSLSAWIAATAPAVASASCLACCWMTCWRCARSITTASSDSLPMACIVWAGGV